MQNVTRHFILLSVLAPLAACGSNGEQQDNRDQAIEANSAVEVDALPADESSAALTPETAGDAGNAATEAPLDAE